MDYKEFCELAQSGNMKFKIIDAYHPIMIGAIRNVKEVKDFIVADSKELIFSDSSKIIIREEDIKFLSNGDIRICRLGTYIYTIRII